MAGMTTTLTEFANSGNSRTYRTPEHTALRPKLIIQRRTSPTGTKTILEDSFNVVVVTEDSEGLVLPGRVSINVTVKRPVNGLSTDVDYAVTTVRDVIASDEFAALVANQDLLA